MREMTTHNPSSEDWLNQSFSKTGLTLCLRHLFSRAQSVRRSSENMNKKPMFPCPVCTSPREVLITKKDKPYLTCDPCGVQVFVRGPDGIAEFERLLQSTSEEPLLARLTYMEQRYRLTCPDCGHKFWITPRLIKTSMFDGSVKGFRCPEKGCEGVALWNEESR